MKSALLLILVLTPPLTLSAMQSGKQQSDEDDYVKISPQQPPAQHGTGNEWDEDDFAEFADTQTNTIHAPLAGPVGSVHTPSPTIYRPAPTTTSSSHDSPAQELRKERNPEETRSINSASSDAPSHIKVPYYVARTGNTGLLAALATQNNLRRTPPASPTSSSQGSAASSTSRYSEFSHYSSGSGSDSSRAPLLGNRSNPSNFEQKKTKSTIKKDRTCCGLLLDWFFRELGID